MPEHSIPVFAPPQQTHSDIVAAHKKAKRRTVRARAAPGRAGSGALLSCIVVVRTARKHGHTAVLDLAGLGPVLVQI